MKLTVKINGLVVKSVDVLQSMVSEAMVGDGFLPPEGSTLEVIASDGTNTITTTEVVSYDHDEDED